MKIMVTVNLGNYESIKVESNEATELRTCLDEVKDSLLVIGTAATKKYATGVLAHYSTNITALQDMRDEALAAELAEPASVQEFEAVMDEINAEG